MKKEIIAISIAGVVLLSVVLTGLPQRIYITSVAHYPDEWLDIKLGMTSKKARELLGSPHADGRGLKPLDRWEITTSGVEMHLDLWFEDQNDENSEITRIVLWKHCLGVSCDKSTNPPWPTKK